MSVTDTSGWPAEQVSELELIQQRKRALETELQELRTELEALDREIKEADLGPDADNEASAKDRLWQNGRHKFNVDPGAGVAYLVEEGLLENTPEAVAAYLFGSTKLRKRAIGKYFSSARPFNAQTLESFAARFNFAGKRMLASLREFLGSFAMVGESQVVERCLSAFAKSYTRQNPDCRLGADRIFVLCYACMILNTQLHNETARRDKLTRIASADDFQVMLERTELTGLDRTFVKEIFDDIRQQPFANGENFQDLLHSMSNVRMEGYLHKQGGKVKTWKRRYCLLQGCRLSYLQDAHSNYPKGFIQLRGLAVRETADKSKSFCFELHSASGDRIEAYKTDSSRSVVAGRHTVYKFSAQSYEELLNWIKALNDAIQEQQFFTIKRSLSYQPQPAPQLQ